jgi:hypothetical protein
MPVPPPDWWTSAHQRACSMISERSSRTGRTKQAASCPFGLPALTRHGVFGRNRRSSMSSIMASVNSLRFIGSVSACATWPTTRAQMSSHSSVARPNSSLSE